MPHNAEMAIKIKAIFDEEKSRAGAKRIAKRLKKSCITVGRHRVARIMRLNGWRAKAARKYKATTNSNHKLPVAPKLLQQNFSANKQNEKYVSDITYIWTEEGWLYLAGTTVLRLKQFMAKKFQGVLMQKIMCSNILMCIIIASIFILLWGI
jgi:transposase InsO family protein